MNKRKILAITCKIDSRSTEVSLIVNKEKFVSEDKKIYEQVNL